MADDSGTREARLEAAATHAYGTLKHVGEYLSAYRAVPRDVTAAIDRSVDFLRAALASSTPEDNE